MEVSLVGQRAPTAKLAAHLYHGLEFCQMGSLRLQVEGTRQIACVHYESLAKFIETKALTEETFKQYVNPQGKAKFGKVGGFLANIDSAMADTLANCSVMIFSGTVAPGHLMLMPAGMVFMETICVSHSKKSGTDSIGLRLGLLYSSPQAWKGYANVKRVYDDLTPKLLATPTACLLKLIIDKHQERLVMQNTLHVMMKHSDESDGQN